MTVSEEIRKAAKHEADTFERKPSPKGTIYNHNTYIYIFTYIYMQKTKFRIYDKYVYVLRNKYIHK